MHTGTLQHAFYVCIWSTTTRSTFSSSLATSFIIFSFLPPPDPSPLVPLLLFFLQRQPWCRGMISLALLKTTLLPARLVISSSSPTRVTNNQGFFLHSKSNLNLFQAPTTIFCEEWRGLAIDLPSFTCQHGTLCEKVVAFESVDTGRRFLTCAQKVSTNSVTLSKVQKAQIKQKVQLSSNFSYFFSSEFVRH